MILSSSQSLQFTTAWTKPELHLNLEDDCFTTYSNFPDQGQMLAQKRVVLLSSDVAFMQKALTIMKSYTRQVDPRAFITESSIGQVVDPAQCKGFTHFVDLLHILPRPVRLFYGAHALNRSDGNCHGAALMAAGLLPMVSHKNCTPIFSTWIDQMLEEVRVADVKAGDLVYLDSHPQNRSDSGICSCHSFVFLSHELCLSANGKGKSLELYSLSDVIKSMNILQTLLQDHFL